MGHSFFSPDRKNIAPASYVKGNLRKTMVVSAREELSDRLAIIHKGESLEPG